MAMVTGAALQNRCEAVTSMLLRRTVYVTGLGDHALLDGQDDIFIYAPYGKSYHKLIGNKRMENVILPP